MNEALVLSRFDELVESGLVHYDAQQQIIEQVEDGLKFQFILTSALVRKPTLQTTQPPQADQPDSAGRREGSDISTADYEVGAVGTGSHFLAVNKFAFARPHLMLLTSDGRRRQHEALGRGDVEAAWAALATTLAGERNVVFFNCGRDAGCSRLHKHMQLMRMPEGSFAAFLDGAGGEDGNSSEEPAVPFYWFHHRFGESGGGQATTTTTTTGSTTRTTTPTTPADVTRVYDGLLAQATRAAGVGGRLAHQNSSSGSGSGSSPPRPGAACPHNVILTRRWIVVIPRRRAAVNKEAGANAIGMLGVIAVGTRQEMDNWVRLGLKEGLRQLGVPR